jgi:hypothetical protein
MRSARETAVSNGRCPMPMTYPLCSSALSTFYTTSTAFFDATEMLVATQRNNSWTKRALIIIVLPAATAAKRVLLNA